MPIMQKGMGPGSRTEALGVPFPWTMLPSGMVRTKSGYYERISAWRATQYGSLRFEATPELSGPLEYRLMARITTTLFPKQPRSFEHQRGVKITLRAIHVALVGVLLGGTVFGVDAASIQPWWLAAVASGVLLLLLDLHESGAMLLQVRGAVVLFKVALLVAWPKLGPWQPWVLGLLVLISVISSHAPSKVRYAMLLRSSGIEGSQSKG